MASIPPRRTAADGSLIALVDCDAFYASCERVARPDLVGKPVVVLSNNDGCVVAMSREAKKLGIPMGEPEYKVRPLLERHKVAVFSSNYTLYGDLSHRVMRTIASVAPRMEIYSIDEAFVPLPRPLALNADNAAHLIRQRVLRWVGLPVSIGIAATKVLAKIATKVAKKYPAYGGVFDLSTCARADEVLATVPVADIWGIGRRGAPKLRSLGIFTALQLKVADPRLIRRELTITGLNLWMEINGVPAIREEIPATHSAVISSRSLGRKIMRLEPLREAAAFHAARAGEKLRARHLEAAMVCPRIQTAYYAEDKPQHDEMVMIRLPRPTADSALLIAAARDGVDRIFRYGYEYAKVMVMLADLSDADTNRPDLVDLANGNLEKLEKRKSLMGLIDRINRVEGRGTLFFAAQGLKNADWHMRRAKLSPSWTTDVQNLPQVSGISRKYGNVPEK